MDQKDELRVEVGRFEIRQGDRFLLCSDGLSNGVRDEEILRMAAAPAPADGECEDSVETLQEFRRNVYS